MSIKVVFQPRQLPGGPQGLGPPGQESLHAHREDFDAFSCWFTVPTQWPTPPPPSPSCWPVSGSPSSSPVHPPAQFLLITHTIKLRIVDGVLQSVIRGKPIILTGASLTQIPADAPLYQLRDY
eukprot:jgi/Botrbrau1/12533/Bobra.0169s0075.1